MCTKGDIPHHWLRCEVALMYKKGDLDHPKISLRIAVTNSIYRVIMKLYRSRVRNKLRAPSSMGQGLCTPRLSKL